jgi:hypothetical protein
VIGKGTTTCKEAKIETYLGVIMKPAESGWPTDNLIVQYFHCPHTKIANGHACLLTVDVSPTHRTEAIIIKAEKCDIEFRFVPTGGISDY